MSQMFGNSPLNMLTTPGLIKSFKTPTPAATPAPVVAPAPTPSPTIAANDEWRRKQMDLLQTAGRSSTILSAPLGPNDSAKYG